MGYLPVAMYRNPISPTISHKSAIMQDRDLYQPGGVSYGVATGRAEYEATLKPQATTALIAPWGGYPKVYLRPIYPISPTISIISILSFLSSIIQDRELSSG